MCGVAGVCLRGHSTTDDAARLVTALLAGLEHRGPDGAGVVARGQAALGMARLRVRSAPQDAVPFVDADGAVFAFNGEVYQAGVRTPAGGLDEARQACGPGTVDGMYAVVASHADDTLEAVRDPLGIKPLYLRESAEGVAFASEVKPLVHAFAEAPIRPEAFAQFLLTGRRVVDGGTFFERIRPVAPGERLTIRSGQVIRSVLAPVADVGRDEPDAAELRAALEEAVDRMFLADRPIGLALSGGIDSTILACLLARRGVRDLPTVSVVPQGTGDGVRALDELGLPGAVRTWRHSWTPFGPAALLDGLPAAVRAFGEPIAMTSVSMYAALARLAAAAGITVLMVGEGADELFAGYRRYVDLYGGAVAGPMDFYLTPQRRELVTELIGPEACAAAADALAAAVGRAGEAVRRRCGIEPATIDVVREFEYEHSLEPLLRRTDHMLMAEGIEGRTPFLHAGVPDLARRYRSGSLVRGTETKAALRDAFADLLPPHYRGRPKQPFRAPVAEWLSGPLLPQVDRVLAEATEMLHQRLGVRPAGMATLRQRLHHGDGPAFTVAFALLATAEWLSWLDEPLVGAGVGPSGVH